MVGGAFTVVSLYWAIGGTGLLDTVGGALEAQARAGGVGILAVVWVSVLLKAVASVLPVLAVMVRGGAAGQWLRRAGWAAGGVITGYGAVLTGGGLLVVSGVIATSADADLRAIRWHAFLWDPWFLAWGVLVLTTMVRSRRRAADQPSSSGGAPPIGRTPGPAASRRTPDQHR
ncbi:MAG: DUF3995 domain-containing protein [Nakamurella sp.]